MEQIFTDKIDNTQYSVTTGKTVLGKDEGVSNTVKSFKPENRSKFITWVQKNYPKDCWCKHIDEYTNIEKAKLGIL